MTITAHEIRRIAVEAAVDPRTVINYLAGLGISRVNRERIVLALKKLKLTALVRKEENK